MKKYQELLALKKELDERIEEARRQEQDKALTTIKQLVSTFGFTLQQVFPLPQPSKKKAAAKYYDPDSGKSWTGRGIAPKWIEGKNRSQYEIKVTQAENRSTPRDESNPFPFQ